MIADDVLHKLEIEAMPHKCTNSLHSHNVLSLSCTYLTLKESVLNEIGVIIVRDSCVNQQRSVRAVHHGYLLFI